MKEYPEIYAVDFDGTLSLGERYPTIGQPNKPLITFLRERQQDTTEAGAPAEEAQGQQDIVDKPFGSRKDYLDTLTPYGAAEYINRHWRNDPGFREAIASVTKLMDWLLQEVDDQGRELEV